jgi:hypothetical protein
MVLQANRKARMARTDPFGSIGCSRSLITPRNQSRDPFTREALI